MYFIQFHAR